MTHRMFEFNVARVQTNGTIRIGTRSSILQVSLYHAMHGSQLTTNLMVAPCVEVDFEQSITVALSYKTIIEHGFLAARHLTGMGICLVLLFIAR